MDEKKVIDACMNGHFDNNVEDTKDFLSSYKCFRVVNVENISETIFQLTHQEIVQRPKYIATCWSTMLKSLTMFNPFKAIEGLRGMFEEKTASPKKVLKLLSPQPENDAKRESFDHLKRFIKSLNDGALSTFLQFTTGSDIIIVDSLEVTFVNVDGLSHRPIAHTCTPSLELPSTYQSFDELSEEFSSLLREKGFWEFDIV